MNCRSRLALGLLSLLTACGGTPLPPDAPMPAPPEPEPAQAVPTGNASDAGASEAEPEAPTPETCDSPDTCTELGVALLAQGDRPGARTAFEKACDGPAKLIDGCAQWVVILAEDPQPDPARLAEASRTGCSTLGANEQNRSVRASACLLWGTAQRDGAGVEKSGDGALKAFHDGCQLGAEPACLAERELQAQRDAATGVPGANLLVGRVSANGVVVEEIACKSQGGGFGGLLGTLTIATPFVQRKARLDACVGGRQKTRVRWTSARGKMANVEVISQGSPADACIRQALAGAPVTVEGTCAATVEIGK